MPDRRPPTVVVIGAGLAGLFAARDLAAAGAAVTVVDKGRGVGGRVATRRLGPATIDHGAQFFTARSASFAAEVAGWLAAGVAAPWFTGVLGADGIVDDDGETRFRGVPAMTGIARHLAVDLDVRLGTRVAAVRADADAWHLGDDGAGAAGPPPRRADALVVTAPAPQTLALLDPAVLDPTDRLALERITYDPCLAVLALLDRPLALGPPGARRPSGEPLAWYADNQAKGVSAVPALTVHGGPATSRTFWEAPDDEVVATLVGAVPAVAAGGARVLEAQVQRWRYAQATARHAEACLVLRSGPPAVVAGDAFGEGGRIEGAARSGMAAATALAERLGLG
ncbi:MAG: FAD-dependent oxidoreductase [Acidimicrobiales bacterium]|nr:FAD-dependent oxidoreductase [Acidimicrobiales bacterium]